MSEYTMRSRVIEELKALHAMAVENPACPGTPDVNCTLGWIELKKLPAWPVRPKTIVRIDHFTPQQRTWHYLRRKAGGMSWFLLQVKQNWLLLDGALAAMYVGQVTQNGLFYLAHAYTTEGLKSLQLTQELIKAPPFQPYNFSREELMLLKGHKT